MLDLKIPRLNLGYRQILNDIHIQIGWGASLFIHGPNGCGKTSLLKAVCGLIKTEMTSSARSTEMLYVGTKSGLDPYLTVAENLERYKLLYQSQKSTNDIAEQFSLQSLLDELPNSLSFGQLQRVNLAKLAIVNKRIWLLDEPLTGLDQAFQDQIRRLANQHLHNKGIILYASHQDLELQNQQVLDLSVESRGKYAA